MDKFQYLGKLTPATLEISTRVLVPMRRRNYHGCFIMLLVCFCVHGAHPSRCDADLIYGVLQTNSQLVMIDASTGVRTNIGTGLGIDDVSVLAFDRSGQLFGVGEGGKQLISINRRTGSASLVGAFDLPQPLARVTGLAVDPRTGTMYATRQLNPPNTVNLSQLPQDLVTVDPNNANSQVVGRLGLGATGGNIAFNSDGELISANRPHPDSFLALWKISTTTGRASRKIFDSPSPIASAFDFGLEHPTFKPIAFDSNGDLLTLDRSDFLARIDDSDPMFGRIQRIGTTQYSDLSSLAVIAVPEPGGLLSASMLLLFAVLYKRRRDSESSAKPGNHVVLGADS